MNFTRNYISNQKSLFFSISPIPSYLTPFFPDPIFPLPFKWIAQPSSPSPLLLPMPPST